MKVVEYLGLPASGKSYNLSKEGYCGSKNAVAHSVPLGGGYLKLKNTFRGSFHNFKLFIFLIKLAFFIYHNEKSAFLIRPFLVILERYGRIIKILKSNKNKEVHLDEGVFQFIWRVFSELKISNDNIKLLEKCIGLLKNNEHNLAYISCTRKNHIRQVIERKKINSNFDAAVVRGDNLTYNKGRFWMAQVLKVARQQRFKIIYVRNN